MTLCENPVLETPVLDGTRFRLVPFEERHLTETYRGWLHDPEVVRYSRNRHRQTSMESCRAYFMTMRDGNHLFWAIEDMERDNCHIGNITVYMDYDNGVGDFAIMVGDPAARGLGAGRETGPLVADWATAPGRLRKLTAGTMALNTGMIRLMGLMGMQDDGCRKAHYLWNGEEIDLIQAARFAKDLTI